MIIPKFHSFLSSVKDTNHNLEIIFGSNDKSCFFGRNVIN